VRKADFVGGVLFFVFALAMIFFVVPAGSSGGVWHGLSPFFYPVVMLTGIAAASIGLLLQAWRKPRLYEGDRNPMSFERLGFFALICTIVLGGVLVTDWLGFWFGCPLLIGASMVFMGERNPFRIIPVSFAPVIVTYVLVTWVLHSPLP
jgi:hypothetical protein